MKEVYVKKILFLLGLFSLFFLGLTEWILATACCATNTSTKLSDSKKQQQKNSLFFRLTTQYAALDGGTVTA